VEHPRFSQESDRLPCSYGGWRRRAQAASPARCVRLKLYGSEFNVRHRRTSTLCEDRCKSCLVGGERYVGLPLIELEPVRAAMLALNTHLSWRSRCHGLV